MSLVALSAGILNTWSRLRSRRPRLCCSTLSTIGAALFVAPLFRDHGVEPVYALAVGVMVGGLPCNWRCRCPC